MAEILVTTPVVLTNEITANESTSSSYRMVIKTSDSKISLSVPIAPREVSYNGWGRVWSEVPRDGQTPYLVHEGYKLPTISFTTILAKHLDPYWDATSTLKKVRDLSNTTVPLRITYGGYFESNYSWRMTNWNFKSVYRHPTTNAITQAELELEFTMAKDAVITISPVKKAPVKKKK